MNCATPMDILQRARNFEMDALAQIYDEYNLSLYYYALHLLGNSELAEDCVAETFSRFLKALAAKGGPRENVKGYLYRSVHNSITDYYRSRKDGPELDDEMPDTGTPEVNAQVELRSEQEQLRRAISRLTHDQAQVIGLHFIEEWDLSEIADCMGKTVGAVKALQHRALVNVGKIMKDGKV